MTATYTPGPWHFERGEVRAPEGLILAIVQYSLTKNALANGQLMAAAPELLEACQFMLDALDTMTTEAFSLGADQEARARLAAAIRTATGEDDDIMCRYPPPPDRGNE